MAETPEIIPLSTDNISDFHIHCDYSIDATGTIEEYCHAALKRRLAEICFTSHFDANPRCDGEANFVRVKGKNLPTTVENVGPYVEHVLRAAEEFYPYGLSVKLGLEVGWYAGCEEQVLKLKESYPFDYLLVGIHELDDECFCARSTYEKCFNRFSREQAVENYVQQVIAAAHTGLFDTVAHLDYIKKYGQKFYGDAVNDDFRRLAPTIFEALKATGTAMEVNTAARRLGFESYYPAIDIVNMARRAGVSVHFLGSDAHRPEHVGYEFEEVIPLVPDAVTHCED
jgi:histidinol-phosphatase (PHP family)